MNTNELFDLIKTRRRICDTLMCDDCPLHDVVCNLNACDDIEDLNRLISKVKEWDAAHPALEPLGDNIYFDSKHKIVADEVMRVYTIELTQIGECERERGHLMTIGKDIANEFAAKAYPYNVDDVKCVRAQQFITKCHEEGV